MNNVSETAIIKNLKLAVLFLLCFFSNHSKACSIVYFIDEKTGTIYIANNEDFWLNTKAYIQYTPDSKKGMARLWYGWDKFAQGGINKAGLFFDGAATPLQKITENYSTPNGRNVGDEILAQCTTTSEALAFLETEKIAVANGHMMFGDKKGNAVVVEWVDGKRNIINIKDHVLIATNYLLSKPEAGGFPCYRYQSIQERIKILKQKETIDFLSFGNTIGGTAQLPLTDPDTGKTGGTLYTSFINLSEMKMFIIPKLDNSKAIQLNLKEQFAKKKKQKIKLY